MKLPDNLVASLQQISRGKPFPWGWLGTCDQSRGAQVRTVRLLSYNWLQGTVYFGSHSDHAKHRQIQQDPRGQLCLLNEEALIQARLDVVLSSCAASQHALGERLWQRLSGNARQQLYGAHPQAPTPPTCFWIVECRATEIDLLELAGEPARRRRFHCGPQGWVETALSV